MFAGAANRSPNEATATVPDLRRVLQPAHTQLCRKLDARPSRSGGKSYIRPSTRRARGHERPPRPLNGQPAAAIVPGGLSRATKWASGSRPRGVGERTEVGALINMQLHFSVHLCCLRTSTPNWQLRDFRKRKKLRDFRKRKKINPDISRESVYSTAGGFTDYSCELYATTTAAPRGRDSRLWTHVWTESLKCTVPALSCYNYCAWRGPSTVLPSGVRCGQNVRADILETGVHAALVITA